MENSLKEDCSSPLLPPAAALEVEVAADAVVDAVAFAVFAAVVAATLTLVVSRAALLLLLLAAFPAATLVVAAPDPVPATGFPFVPISWTAAKFVVVPNTALNASACAPVPFAAASAADVAFAHRVCAAALALHALLS